MPRPTFSVYAVHQMPHDSSSNVMAKQRQLLVSLRINVRRVAALRNAPRVGYSHRGKIPGRIIVGLIVTPAGTLRWVDDGQESPERPLRKLFGREWPEGLFHAGGREGSCGRLAHRALLARPGRSSQLRHAPTRVPRASTASIRAPWQAWTLSFRLRSKAGGQIRQNHLPASGR